MILHCAQNFALDLDVIPSTRNVQLMFGLHNGSLTPSMHHPLKLNICINKVMFIASLAAT